MSGALIGTMAFIFMVGGIAFIKIIDMLDEIQIEMIHIKYEISNFKKMIERIKNE